MKDVIAGGMSGEEWLGLLKGPYQVKAQKALNYLDGKIEDELIKTLNDPSRGRHRWGPRGIIPRFRNLTQAIIEKSGPLFQDALPTINLFDKGSSVVNERDTQLLSDVMSSIPFQEILISDDQVRRLLKTSVWLMQWDSSTSQLIIDILHRANCGTIVDGAKNITGLIYATSDETYRIYTPETITDIYVGAETHQVTIQNQVPNPLGIVPASFFYDTHLPRTGTWIDSDSVLVNFNEAYNLHLTDSEFTMRWMKNPTFVMIDCDFDSSTQTHTVEVLENGDKLPVTRSSQEVTSGGPDAIIGVASNGGTASVQYVGPQVDIQPMDEVFSEWTKSVGADYSVRIKSSGEGMATSGFQLVVEEIPNLELRKMRARMFGSGMKRVWPILRKVLNSQSPFTFSESTEMFVEFQAPKLPVDAMAQEEVWSKRISEGRASLMDYFTVEMGMTSEEALAKITEIEQFKRVPPQPDELTSLNNQNAFRRDQDDDRSTTSTE